MHNRCGGLDSAAAVAVAMHADVRPGDEKARRVLYYYYRSCRPVSNVACG